MGECPASQCAVNTLISKQLSTQTVAYYCLQFMSTSHVILSREIKWQRLTQIDEGLGHILKMATYIVSNGSSGGNFDVYLCNSTGAYNLVFFNIQCMIYTLAL